jgi:hypothetical protein
MSFCETFSWLPLAAVVNSKIFCVHGGLGPGLRKIEQIEEIVRPVTDSRAWPYLHSMVWADPDPSVTTFTASARGDVPTFGVNAVQEFLQENGCRLLVRAHKCVDGIEHLPTMWTVTVFSASAYVTDPVNRSGILRIRADGSVREEIFPALDRIQRIDATFYTMRHHILDVPGNSSKPAGLLGSFSQQHFLTLGKVKAVWSSQFIPTRIAPGLQERRRVVHVGEEAHESFPELETGKDRVKDEQTSGPEKV